MQRACGCLDLLGRARHDRGDDAQLCIERAGDPFRRASPIHGSRRDLAVVGRALRSRLRQGRAHRFKGASKSFGFAHDKPTHRGGQQDHT